MPTAASSAGFGTGFRAGLDTARQRRIDDQERARLRQRQDVADQRAAEQHELGVEADRITLEAARRANSPEAVARAERLQELQLGNAEVAADTGRLTLDRLRRADEREPDEIARTREREDFELNRARTQAEREDINATRADEEYARVREQMAAEGLPEIFSGLRAGVDPNLLLRRFNQTGSKKLRGIGYDPATGNVRLEDEDGEVAEHPLDQWMTAYPMPADALVKLGENDRLVNPRTGDTVIGATGGGADGEGNTAGGPRKTSPYNPEGVQKDMRAIVVRSAGGELGPLGEIMGITDPEARKLVDYQGALASNMEGRLREHIKSGKIGVDAVANAVIEATRDIPTEAELARRAEEWRTEPVFNRDQASAALWMEQERTKLRAQAEAKLIEQEQKLLGNAAAPERPAVFEKPDWAGAEIPAATLGGAQLEQGYEYDVEVDGRKSTIRLGADGKVYEVRGPAAPPTAAVEPEEDDEEGAVRSSLAAARRAGQFLY